MKLVLDFIVVIALFVSYKWSNDMMVATKVAMVAAGVQLVLMRVLHYKIEVIHWFGFVMLLVLGAMSLLFNNPRFLQWKFTLLEWLLALILIAGQLIWRKNLLQTVIGKELVLPENVWQQLLWVWVAYFVFLGGLNWYIFAHFDNHVWMNFKLFGTLVITLAFLVAQGVWLWRYLPKDDFEE